MQNRKHRLLFIIGALAIALLAITRLEGIRASVTSEKLEFGETPVTLYRRPSPSDLLVVVSHGFAGSRQMMEAISLSLARDGHTVVAFDFIGHGRHPRMLSPAIERITGTTEDLVQQTLDVAAQARSHTGLERTALVGHSMATDVVIRAAERLENIEGVAAISMYSDAVSQDHPARLLIVSGAQETRLRSIALDAVALVGEPVEGRTVSRNDAVLRRAVAAPWVGHVGVLWSPITAKEISDWFSSSVSPALTGPWIAILLVSVLALFLPVAAILPKATQPRPIPLRWAVLSTLLAAAAAFIFAGLGLPVGGVSGFGSLALALGAWGLLVLLVLKPTYRLQRTDLLAAALLLSWGVLVFALLLDRYGASFVPTGARAMLMASLLPATMLFCVADRILVHDRGIVARFLFRIPILVALVSAMATQPTSFGLLFTVAPVLVLFLLVYGTMARWASIRSGPIGPGLASGIILAWSIAASTPLFQA